jgi:hypothetical protein
MESAEEILAKLRAEDEAARSARKDNVRIRGNGEAKPVPPPIMDAKALRACQAVSRAASFLRGFEMLAATLSTASDA